MSTDINAEDFAKPVSHHISDVDVWLHPDRNYYVFVVLTFLFGFIGLDHMYLRSNETAFKKLLLNIVGLGIWYFWDIIQVLKDGPTVRKHGLNSPFDWIRGIGRGMFTGPVTAATSPTTPTKEYAAPKSYFLYTLLAIGLGALGADKFYLGKTWMGVAKVFSVFNIFLFLFGIMWVLWDAAHAYFGTRGIMKDGITSPLPFSWFFDPIDPTLFKVQEVKDEPVPKNDGFLSKLPIPSLPVLPFRELYNELVVPLLQPTVGTAIQSVNKVVSVGTKAAALGATALTAGPAFVGDLANQVSQQATAAATAATAATSIPQIQQIAETAAANRQQPQPQPQLGGGHANTAGGPGPILAGAFTAILLAGGLKGAYDFLAKQTA